MSTRSLVVGASGQIGEHCLAALRSGNNIGFGTYKQHSRPGLAQLDVTDVAAFDRILEESRPQTIYFTASLANVDYCELHPDISYETNVIGVRNAVELASRHRCKLVYMSSEYLFDGVAGPYGENAPANPLSVYGRHKLAAEHYIATFANDSLIVRTAVVYSWESQGKNFLYRLRSALLERRQINVPIDQISCPTFAPDLVRAMIQLVEQDQRGVFNVCGPRVASRHAFALAAADAFDLDRTLIVPVVTSDLNQVALRPLKGGLIVDKVEGALGRSMVDFSAGLREMASKAPVA